MKYKLFISDYDGTLGQAPENVIDSQTLEAIAEFEKKGGVFVVCSGRETASIMPILKKFNIKGLVASLQGAKISDIESGKEIFSGGLSTEKALEAIDAVNDTGLTPLFYYKGEMFYREFTPYIAVYEKAVAIKGEITDVAQKIKELNDNISKICWLGDDKVVCDTAERLNAIYKGQGVKFNSGAKCLLEAINPDCGKDNAVRFLAKHYNISLEETLAVGDSTNDIPLLSGEWHGVAVGDGKEELKRIADEITVPFKEKPVLHLLKKYCL